jgi:streptogramin lyase
MQKHWWKQLFLQLTGSIWAQMGSLLVGVSVLAGLVLFNAPLAQAKVGTFAEFPIPTANSTPAGIAVGPDRNLWFTESDKNQIGRLTPNKGNQFTEFALPTNCGNQQFGCGPEGITTGPDGNLWFTAELGNLIGRITTDGTITEFPLANGSAPEGITTGPDGNLWFTDLNDQIGRITPAGTITEFNLPTNCGGFGCAPIGITAGPDGNIWFTEQSGNQIGRIIPADPPVGPRIAEFPLPTTCGSVGGCEPFAITAGPKQSLWFTEQSGNTIGSLTANGKG